jgi:hypothetical protein
MVIRKKKKVGIKKKKEKRNISNRLNLGNPYFTSNKPFGNSSASQTLSLRDLLLQTCIQTSLISVVVGICVLTAIPVGSIKLSL